MTFNSCICSTDNTPPVISSVSASDITYSGAIITWITDEYSTSEVEYGTTAGYGSTSSPDRLRTKSHAVELTGLNPDTTYYYRVISKDSSGNKTLSAGKSFHTKIEEAYNLEYEWDFRDKTWNHSTEIRESDYDYFAGKPRAGDYDEYVLNTSDDAWMRQLAGLFVEQAKEEGWDETYYVPFALSFVQSLPYTDDDVTTGYDEYPRYPLETIKDEGGDCEDTSILFASIVREMDFGVALLLLKEDGHMAAGVQISQSFIDNWDKAYPCTYYEKDGKMYAYCETTSKGWEIGEMPRDLSGDDVIIYVF
ncbi:fibronectin type III domain-containing protein [Chloroflexota bacterium]